MKYEWRKNDKAIYLPKKIPMAIDVPSMTYAVIEGKGSPDDPIYGEVIGALYAFSFTLKMLPKKGITPEGYFEYAVFPLEGCWWTEDESADIRAGLNKEAFVYQMMIRQPDFVDNKLFQTILGRLTKKVSPELTNRLKMKTIKEGLCVQMMHIGSYEKEFESFDLMDAYCEKEGLVRVNDSHREIYLSDPRRVSPEKMRTVLRYEVKKK